MDDSFGENSWDLLDYNFLNDNTTDVFSWLNSSPGTQNYFPAASVQECTTNQCELESPGTQNYFPATSVSSRRQECTTNQFDLKSSGTEWVATGSVWQGQKSSEKTCVRKSCGPEWTATATGLVSLEQESSEKECIRKSCGPEWTAPGLVSQEQESSEKECVRKRGRSESCGGSSGTKACREKLRREKLNEKFIELSSCLEPDRPAKTDKIVLLGDATRVLNQLRTEAQELKEANEKLQEELKNLKAEKNELREEKLTLKADKERVEQHIKAMTTPPAIMPPYYPSPKQIPTFPYGMMPMWQYLPPSSVDTSHDHELRPPAA